jgi:hypothetical protein
VSSSPALPSPPLRGVPGQPARAERSGAPRLARESRRRQRERERERRVSDADASYEGPVTSTMTLTCAIPQEKHANNNPLCDDPVPLHWSRPKRLQSTTKPTQTQPYVYPDNPMGVKTLAILYRNDARMSSSRAAFLERNRWGRGSRWAKGGAGQASHRVNTTPCPTPPQRRCRGAARMDVRWPAAEEAPGAHTTRRCDARSK